MVICFFSRDASANGVFFHCHVGFLRCNPCKESDSIASLLSVLERGFLSNPISRQNMAPLEKQFEVGRTFNKRRA